MLLLPLKMEEESDVQPVNKTYNTIEPKVIDSLLRARETLYSYLKSNANCKAKLRRLHRSLGKAKPSNEY